MRKTLLCYEWGSCRQHPEDRTGGGGWALTTYAWRGPGGERMLIAVNHAPHPSQCYLSLPFDEIRDRSVRLQDALGPACCDRDGNEPLERGLCLDLQPWSYHVFELEVSE